MGRPGRRRLTQTAGPLSAFAGRSGSKGEVVKRIRLFTLLSVLAVALSVGLLPGVAEANNGSGSPNQVTIQPQASYNFAGTMINVGLNIKCQGGSGDVI